MSAGRCVVGEGKHGMRCAIVERVAYDWSEFAKDGVGVALQEVGGVLGRGGGGGGGEVEGPKVDLSSGG